MASVQQIIGKVNPLLYAENGKELLKKYKSLNEIPADEVEPKDLGKHDLIYDSPSETLEPIYFFLLDLMNTFGFETEKVVDNFTSSPGSDRFGEFSQKASIMQQQASKLLADIGMVMRSLLNITYDLKELRTRLRSYDDLNSKNKNEARIHR